MDIETLIREQAVRQNRPVREIRYEFRKQLESSLGINQKRERNLVFSEESRIKIQNWANEDWTISKIAETLGKTVAQVRGVLMQLNIRGLRL